MSTTPPPQLKAAYDSLAAVRETMQLMKKQQSLRGPENYMKRMHERDTTHKTWRQLKGVDKFFYEINAPGTKPFVMGLGIVSTFAFYLFFTSSESSKQSSDYYQRYFAKHENEAAKQVK